MHDRATETADPTEQIAHLPRDVLAHSRIPRPRTMFDERVRDAVTLAPQLVGCRRHQLGEPVAIPCLGKRMGGIGHRSHPFTLAVCQLGSSGVDQSWGGFPFQL